jgi:hypothetical protein
MTAPKIAGNEQPMAHAPVAKPTGTAGDGNLAEPMPLDQFLEGVANIYDLAPKEVAPDVLPPKPKRVRPTSKRVQQALAAGVALSLVAFFGVKLSSTEIQGVLPTALRGEWVTKHPGYEKRLMRISAGELTFQVGRDADSVTIHKIQHVTQTSQGEDTTNFSVDYEADGGSVNWQFQYIQRPKPIIRFQHQKELIWTPVPVPGEKTR